MECGKETRSGDSSSACSSYVLKDRNHNLLGIDPALTFDALTFIVSHTFVADPDDHTTTHKTLIPRRQCREQ
jgi:hypothetical protein